MSRVGSSNFASGTAHSAWWLLGGVAWSSTGKTLVQAAQSNLGVLLPAGFYSRNLSPSGPGAEAIAPHDPGAILIDGNVGPLTLYALAAWLETASTPSVWLADVVADYRAGLRAGQSLRAGTTAAIIWCAIQGNDLVRVGPEALAIPDGATLLRFGAEPDDGDAGGYIAPDSAIGAAGDDPSIDQSPSKELPARTTGPAATAPVNSRPPPETPSVFQQWWNNKPARYATGTVVAIASVALALHYGTPHPKRAPARRRHA